MPQKSVTMSENWHSPFKFANNSETKPFANTRVQKSGNSLSTGAPSDRPLAHYACAWGAIEFLLRRSLLINDYETQVI